MPFGFESECNTSAELEFSALLQNHPILKVMHMIPVIHARPLLLGGVCGYLTIILMVIPSPVWIGVALTSGHHFERGRLFLIPPIARDEGAGFRASNCKDLQARA